MTGRLAPLVSADADSCYWLLDPADVNGNGEWAAYVWASWYPGLGDRFDSFADLIAAEGAAERFESAARKGSGAGQYLAVVMAAFLQPDAHHRIRNDVLAHPHVVEAAGAARVRAELVPLFLKREPGVWAQRLVKTPSVRPATRRRRPRSPRHSSRPARSPAPACRTSKRSPKRERRPGSDKLTCCCAP